MTIQLICPHCSSKLKVKDELAGRRGKCPNCKERVEIPEVPEERADANDPGVDAAIEELMNTPITESSTAEDSAIDDAMEPIPFDSLTDDEPTPQIIIPGNNEGGSRIDKPAPIERAAKADGKIFDPEDVPHALGLLNHYLIVDHKEVVARWENNGRGWMIHLKDGFTRASGVAAQIPNFGNFLLIEIGVRREEDGLHLSNITIWELNRQYSLPKVAKGDDAILEGIIGYAELNDRQRAHVRDLIKSKFLPHMWAEMDAILE